MGLNCALRMVTMVETRSLIIVLSGRRGQCRSACQEHPRLNGESLPGCPTPSWSGAFGRESGQHIRGIVAGGPGACASGKAPGPHIPPLPCTPFSYSVPCGVGRAAETGGSRGGAWRRARCTPATSTAKRRTRLRKRKRALAMRRTIDG